MEYKVELTAEAISNIRDIHNYIDADGSQAAASWYLGLRDMIFSLNRLPERGRATREDPRLSQVLYGNRPHIYRIIYAVDQATQSVTILHIRHGARRAFQLSDIAG